MEINLNQRKSQLNKLTQFITSATNEVETLVGSLGWSVDDLKKSEIRYNCPYNPGHVICTRTANEHIGKCYLKSQGYKLDEEFLSEPKNESKSSIKIDHGLKIQILNHARSTQHDFKPVWDGLNSEPMTSSRLTSTFSASERLALYNYSIAHTEKPKVPEDLPLFSEINISDKNLSYEEIQALKRDSRRRRVKYKAVHTNKKSYKEVIREVIDNQMEIYEDYVNYLNKDKKRVSDTSNPPKDIERPHSSTSKHSGASSRHSRRHEHRNDRSKEKSYDRERSRERHHKRHRDEKKRHRSREYSRERRSYHGDRKHEQRRSRSDKRH